MWHSKRLCTFKRLYFIQQHERQPILHLLDSDFKGSSGEAESHYKYYLVGYVIITWISTLLLDIYSYCLVRDS